MTMLRKVRSLFRRPREERRALVIALALLVVSQLMLRVLPLGMIRRMLFGHGNAGLRPAGPAASGRRSGGGGALRAGVTPDLIAWSIESASRQVSNSTCLVRTLAGRLFFALAGLESRAHLGAASEGGSPTFHAWLEHDGRAVIGAQTAMPRSFFV